MKIRFTRLRILSCAAAVLAAVSAFPLSVSASDQVLVGAGFSSPDAEPQTRPQENGTERSSVPPAEGAGSTDSTGDTSPGSAESTDSTDGTSLGDAGYNGGLTMLGSGSTLTAENTADEYEWVKTNMAGRFYPYVIVHAEGNPNVIHFLYEYGHDAKSPSSFSYTEDERQTFSASGGSAAGRVPLLMQWDYRWGFNWYGGGPAGLTACAPTCMVMIGLGLTGKDTVTVPEMCRYAEDKGYWVSGQGTSWSLVTDAFPDDPVSCQTLPVDEGSISWALSQGYPVLINVGVGKFSAVGHFMVLTGQDTDGKFILKDPNNLENSRQTWAWSDLGGEIQAAWCYSLNS